MAEGMEWNQGRCPYFLELVDVKRFFPDNVDPKYKVPIPRQK